MKKPTKLAGLLGVVAMVAIACGPGGTASTAPTGGASQPAGTTTATQEAKLTGTLTVWHTYASGAGTEKTTYDEIIADIQSKNPGLTISTVVQNFFSPNSIFDKYALEVPTGGGPDMFIVPNDSLGAQVRQSLLEPLDSLVSADDLSVFAALSVEGCKVDGKLYCIPESLKAVGLYYDKTAVPTPPKTVDELLQMQKDGKIKLGVNQGAYHNFGYWAAYGGQLMDASGVCTADTTGVDKAHQLFKDLKAAGAMWSGFNNYAKVADAFKQGQINVFVDGPWASGGYLESLGDKLAVTALPTGPSGPSKPMTGTDGWFINPNSANKELAVAVGLLISTEYEQRFVDKAGHVPALTSATITDPITKGFSEAVANGLARPQVKELDNFWTNFDNALNAVIDKGTDPAQAVSDACTAMDKANKK